jgi:hypothetical protein
MKKYLPIIALAVLAACGGEDKNASADTQPEAPLAQSKNYETFNSSFSNFLNNYYHLKDALVLSNEQLAIEQAKRLASSADSVNLAELKADPSIIEMAKQSAQTISTEAKALAGQKDLEAKRKSFQAISDNMYDLVRTVRYDRETVYHQFCPMAFNDAGAYWLSRTSDIKNPYFGKKMLTCGEVKDSVDFRGQ